MILLVVIVALMALATFAHGRGNDPTQPGSWPKWCRLAGKLFLAIGFGATAAVTWGWPFFLLGGISGWAFSKGHGNFYHDGTLEFSYPDEPEWLERWTGMHWLLPRLGLPPRSPWYCRIMMGIKGALIGLPAYPYGLALAVYWPLAYSLGFREFDHSSPHAEAFSGAFAGTLIWAQLFSAGAI